MKKVIYVKNSYLKHFNDIKSEMNVKNNSLYYTVASIFNFSNLAKTSMSYAERCFLMVVETNNFLELDFTLVKNILCSSKLHITSELEVFKAINNWISYKPEERINLAKDLLLTVRLPLLSEPALNHLMNETFTVSKVNECKRIINGVFLKDTNVLNSLPKNIFDVRYCDQESFNFFFCNKTGSIKQMNGKSFENVKSTTLSILTSKHERIDTGFFLKDDLYIFVNNFANNTTKVKKVSEISKDWENVFNFKDRICFCACSLIDKIYIIGGDDNYYNNLISCIQFDTMNNKLKEIAKMNQARKSAACTNYKGKIVVSGGEVLNGIRYSEINTVEVFDHIANTWTYMPSMVERRSVHSLVPIKSKLFVIGNSTCEIYDEVTKVFTLIQVPFIYTGIYKNVTAISLGNKIALLRGVESGILFLDAGTDKWCEKVFGFLDKNYFPVFLKMPQM